MPLETPFGLSVRLGIAAAGVFDGLHLFLSLAARFDQLRESLTFLLRSRKPVASRQVAKIPQRFQPISALILIVSTCNPRTYAFARRRPIAQETTKRRDVAAPASPCQALP